MKSYLFLIIIITAAALSVDGVPVTVERLETHFVNQFDYDVDSKATGEDWQLIPDGNGQMHMIDVNAFQEIYQRSLQYNTDEVSFWLYTRSNPHNPQMLYLNDTEQLQNSFFNPIHPTKFIIHGWTNSGNSSINVYIRTAYLEKGNFNVVVVDWSSLAAVSYIPARSNIKFVGQVVAQFIDSISEQLGISFESISIIGHSLGAHTAGFAGKLVTRGRIQTIIALDPAAPMFSYNRPLERLDYSDALYVEIIHTDIKLFGFKYNIGHASFYPNYGTQQPGCEDRNNTFCDHNRAWLFYAESITSTLGFWGVQCKGGFDEIILKECTSDGLSNRMGGEPANGLVSGLFYVPTGQQSPFALGPEYFPNITKII